MAESTTPTKRVLPARERRESAAKRQASMSISGSIATPAKTISVPTSVPETTATPTTAVTEPATTTSQLITETPAQTETPQPSTEPPRQKRKYTKRAHLLKAQPGSGTQTPSVYEDVLPAKLASIKTLPITSQKPLPAYSLLEYQSVAESAILAASLYKSRVQWLCDGIFKRYWTKPVKRKGAVEAPSDNPDPKSMHKLGGGTITVEPHTFDVVFFTVKETQMVQPTVYRHANQHTPKTSYIPPPIPSATLYTPNFTSSPSTSVPPVSVLGTPNATTFQKPQNPVPQQPTPRTSTLTATTNIKHEPSSPKSSHSQPTPPPQPRPPPPPLPPPSRSTNDPVIQMLASRAAVNPHLKDLMKVVATSRANPEQLKEFQAHIDEFNAILKRQEDHRVREEKERANRRPDGGSSSDKSTSTQPNPVAVPSTSTIQPPSLGAAHPATYKPVVSPNRPPLATPGVPGSAPAYLPYHSPQAPPPPRQETIVKHVVMELTSSASSTQPASQDRWLFPEHAVLDLRFGPLEMVCSFLVERSGLELTAKSTDKPEDQDGPSSTRWDAHKEYFQPVTMTVKATHHRVIETIARSAKSLPTVQEHMKTVMKKKVRAPQAYLLYQLPRERRAGSIDTTPAGGEFVDSGVEVSNDEDDDLKDFYGVVA